MQHQNNQVYHSFLYDFSFQAFFEENISRAKQATFDENWNSKSGSIST